MPDPITRLNAALQSVVAVVERHVTAHLGL